LKLDDRNRSKAEKSNRETQRGIKNQKDLETCVNMPYCPPSRSQALAKPESAKLQREVKPTVGEYRTIQFHVRPFLHTSGLFGTDGTARSQMAITAVRAAPNATQQLPKVPVNFKKFTPRSDPATTRHYSSSSRRSRAKKVHFAAELEQVRSFFYTEEPRKISFGYGFAAEISDRGKSTALLEKKDIPRKEGQLSRRWELRPLNFLNQPTVRQSQCVVHLEQCSIVEVDDTRTVAGEIVAKNIAYGKHISIRFTFDAWVTMDDITAQFKYPQTLAREGKTTSTHSEYDHFSFAIEIPGDIDLKDIVLMFCIRYDVNNTEYWDNNDCMNYQLCFSKVVISSPRSIFKNTSPSTPPANPTSSTPSSHPSTLDNYVKTFTSFGELNPFAKTESTLH
jgi:hypothetical protein